MTVSAVIRIEQYGGPSSTGGVLNSVRSLSSKGDVQNSTHALEGEIIFNHLPHVSSPTSRPTVEGWETESKNHWSDSPTRQPNLPYHLRFGFGRDRREKYEVGYGSLVTPPADGSRWGNLDDNSTVLMYERDFPHSSEGSVRQYKVSSEGDILEKDVTLSSTKNVSHIPGVSGDVDVELFPFLITALPEPYSYRNPIDTDVFVRLANFTFPIASGTINLFLDDVQRTPLQVSSFTGGLGGFDVTWQNDQLFNYDSRVEVRWEFFDTDAPANKTIIRYPFYTVPDLAPPRVENMIPENGASNIPVLGPIQFDLIDYEASVDISTLRLYVNNVLITDGVNGDIDLTETNNSGRLSYTVRYTPVEEWLKGDLIPVSLFVKDTSANKNELFFSYSFTTTEAQAPRLINLDPESCAVEVPTGTNVQADVIDGGSGLDTDSIVITVDDVERGNDVTRIPIVHRDE
jgi:hypothetical protein